ncbi:hypothetical protein CEXT_471531 [Caerostris extrusa]|uniref:Secreted protein n=1 Tax=Caerostris extrusa TaxID=172846 RepID=A0AAV4XMV4_CAEEX|nr:hypothetical protein CEXT_471531 [Caerostris extrusa]
MVRKIFAAFPKLLALQTRISIYLNGITSSRRTNSGSSCVLFLFSDILFSTVKKKNEERIVRLRLRESAPLQTPFGDYCD